MNGIRETKIVMSETTGTYTHPIKWGSHKLQSFMKKGNKWVLTETFQMGVNG